MAIGVSAPDGATSIQRLPIYHARDVADPGVVISFGLVEGSSDELREAQEQLGRQSRVQRIDPGVQEVLLDGSYEVVEELDPGAVRDAT